MQSKWYQTYFLNEKTPEQNKTPKAPHWQEVEEPRIKPNHFLFCSYSSHNYMSSYGLAWVEIHFFLYKSCYSSLSHGSAFQGMSGIQCVFICPCASCASKQAEVVQFLCTQRGLPVNKRGEPSRWEQLSAMAVLPVLIPCTLQNILCFWVLRKLAEVQTLSDGGSS